MLTSPSFSSLTTEEELGRNTLLCTSHPFKRDHLLPPAEILPSAAALLGYHSRESAKKKVINTGPSHFSRGERSFRREIPSSARLSIVLFAWLSLGVEICPSSRGRARSSPQPQQHGHVEQEDRAQGHHQGGHEEASLVGLLVVLGRVERAYGADLKWKESSFGRRTTAEMEGKFRLKWGEWHLQKKGKEDNLSSSFRRERIPPSSLFHFQG